MRTFWGKCQTRSADPGASGCQRNSMADRCGATLSSKKQRITSGLGRNSNIRCLLCHGVLHTPYGVHCTHPTAFPSTARLLVPDGDPNTSSARKKIVEV